MKYIDKDGLIKTLQKSPVWTGLDAIARINAMDTIDIVRCKECIWYKDFDGCFFSTDEVEPNGFCSYGERKDNE